MVVGSAGSFYLQLADRAVPSFQTSELASVCFHQEFVMDFASHRPRPWVICVFAMISLWQVDQVAAQTKLTEGESVKVFFLNSWYDGVVLGRDKNRYGVEFEFAATQKRELFNRAQIRKLCEVEALDLSRSWESANGKFKVDAALKGFTGDKVVLAKTDGNDVEIPAASLSENDQNYLKKFKKSFEEATRKGAIPALVPKLPPLETFNDSSESNIGAIIGEGKIEPLGATPNFLREFKQSGMGLQFARRDQRLTAVIPVGGPEQWVLVTAREDNFFNKGTNFQSQAYWVSLKQQKIVGSVPLTPEDSIVDYDPRSKLLVSVHRDKTMGLNEKGSITVWNHKPAESEAKPLVRWETPLTSWAKPLYVKLINDHTLLLKTENNTYKAWDFRQKQVLYAFKSASFFDAAIVLTADRKHLLLPEDGKVTVLNAEDGQLKFSLPVNDRHVSGVNIDPSGTRLVCLTESNVHVWDLKTSNPTPTSYPAPLIGSPFQSRIEWVNDDLILANSQQNRTLYRLSLKLPVWSYRMDADEWWLNENPLTNQVLNGLFFYVAAPKGNSISIAVGAVELPGPKVDELTKNLNSDSLMLLKNGSRVGLKMESVSNSTQVEKWLIEKIKANGWVYDPNAAIQIHAGMGVGEKITQRYRQMGGRGKTIDVTFTPHFAKLTIKTGDVIIWQTGTSTGAPPIVHDSDIQAAVARSEVPPVDFFRHVTIPNEIIDPKYSRGFGVSKLGIKGIEVESTTPPGRDADPFAAENKMHEENLKKNQNNAQNGN